MALNISDDYLYGFIDGEGSFYIGIVPSRETKSGWQVIHFFSVSQNPKGKVVLDYLKKRLQCGYVKPNASRHSSDKSLVFSVRDLSSLSKKVLPFLRGKLMVKRKAAEQFEMVIKMVEEKKHLSKEGMKQVIDTAYSMNTGKRKVPADEILSLFN